MPLSALSGRHAIALLQLVLSTSAGAHLPDYLAPNDEQVDLRPAYLVSSFLTAVDREGLAVFGMPLRRGALLPRRVEYVYDLQSRTATRRVYADLLPPLEVPGQQDCEVRGVSVTLSALGKIIESEAHVWCQ